MEKEKYIEKENFRALIETDGKEAIQERLNIIDVFLGTEDHVTLEEMCSLLREKGYDYTPQFVRQSINRMADLGFAQKKHHDHLICTKCGKIEEFSDEDMERLQISIAAERGFHVLQHKMEIYGLCSQCLARRRPLIPLLIAKQGERVVVREMTGGRIGRARLADMGLRPGDHLEIINNTGKGRIILAHDCTRLAIGRGIAKKIMVSLSDSEEDALCRET